MKGVNEHSDWQPVAAGVLQNTLPTKSAPYELSLIGEYARLLLLLLAFPLLIWFTHSVTSYQSGYLYLAATSVLLTSLISARGYHVVRIAVLLAMTVNVLAMVINPNDTAVNIAEPPSDLPNYVLLLCLLIASLFEIRAWAQPNSRPTWIKAAALGMLAIPAIAYVVGIPLFNALLDTIQGDENQLAIRDPKWSISNEVAFRAAKFTLFAVVTYLGACLGSFLNVVAYCLPRGHRIGFRDSKCPQCNTKISRIDNLPVFSYINLGARCRNCSKPISVRYLVVELVVASIFGSLFLYELVTGCANVPLMNIRHAGILWIILYPKWPAIAMYLFHALFMCGVLVLSLIEWDRQPLKLIVSTVVGLGFFVAAAIYLRIQPVPLLEHLPGISATFSPWIEQLLKLTTGGFVGALFGLVIGKGFSASHPSALTFAFSLTGLVLGWQALLQVTILFGLITGTVRLWPRVTTLLQCRPTTILLVAIAIHHPFWKTVADWWRFN